MHRASALTLDKMQGVGHTVRTGEGRRMNCRYCGGVYAVLERTCGGCGSPKTAVETFLDVPAAPGHWSHSMTTTVQRVATISGAVGVGAVLLGLIGLKSLGAFIAFFWMMPLASMGLAMGAWQSSVGKLAERARNFMIAGFMWFGISIGMLLVIGLTATL